MGDLAVRVPGDRYLGLTPALASADIVHAQELGYWYSMQAARLKAQLGFRLALTVWETLPFADAFTTMLSIIAQFLMTRKILDNWTLWIIADVVYIAMYTLKALYWTAGLYVVFLILCVQGYREWSRGMK